MTDSTPPPGSGPNIPGLRPALVARVRNILLRPKEEWAVIDAEPATIQGLFTGYAMLLAAIPAVASLIGGLVFGYGAMGFHYRPSIVGALTGAVTTYVMSLISVAVLALVIEFLAPQFGSEKNRIQAFKVATYCMTAGWVAGIFNIFPPLAILAVIGSLYGLYLLYLGLPLLMRTPADKSMTYFIVVLVVAIVVGILVSAVTTALLSTTSARYVDNAHPVTGTVAVPGYGVVDVGKAEAAGDRVEAAIAQALGEGGGASGAALQPVEGAALAALLPASIDGFSRGAVEASSGGMGDLETAEVSAVYASGDARLTLAVADLGEASAVAQLAGAFKLDRTEKDDAGYERVSTVGGRMTTESYDRARRSGHYSVVVADRFMVAAEGRNMEMSALRAAVSAVDFARLEAMARG